jgi:hypothetical protein
MTRLLTVLAATALAGAVAAALALSAGATQKSPGPPGSTDATFVMCLRSHGLAIPAGTRGAPIKQWIIAHESDPAVEPALKACQPAPGTEPSPPELVACLRDHGLNPPATIDQLKPWMASQSQTPAGRTALTACGFDAHPDEKPSPGAPEKQPADCGGATTPAGKDQQPSA